MFLHLEDLGSVPMGASDADEDGTRPTYQSTRGTVVLVPVGGQGIFQLGSRCIMSGLNNDVVGHDSAIEVEQVVGC